MDFIKMNKNCWFYQILHAPLSRDYMIEYLGFTSKSKYDANQDFYLFARGTF